MTPENERGKNVKCKNPPRVLFSTSAPAAGCYARKNPPPENTAETAYLIPRVVVPGCVSIRVRDCICGNVEKFRAVEFLDSTGRVLFRAIAAVPAQCHTGIIAAAVVPGVGV
jgi:hypothetical protein